VNDPRTPEWRSERTGRVNAYGQYGVLPWDQASHTVTSEAAQGSGPFSVADPRVEGFNSTYGVVRWDEASGTVTAHAMPTSGAFSVADPRLADERFGNAVRVSQWDQPAHTVTSTKGGDQAIADPRLACDVNDKQGRRFCDVLRVTGWDEAAGTVTGATGNSRPNVADPRRMENPIPEAWKAGKDSYESGGHYGVVDWDQASPTVVGHAKHDRGRFSVADRRVPLYDGKDKPVNPPIIISLDGTWHRPFTTLELAALQGFEWERLIGRGLYGDNDGDWRERIGNAVPPPAATAIASTMAETLLLARLGHTLPMDSRPVWVSPLATVLSIDC
jgi:site-specific DNA-cytosine methylase